MITLEARASEAARAEPGRDRGGDFGLDLRGRTPRPARHRERMVALLDRVEGGALAEAAEHCGQEVRARERVPRALHEEHGGGDGGQVSVTEGIEAAGRVEGIPEEDESVRGQAGRHRLRCDAPSHRLASQDQPGGSQRGPRVRGHRRHRGFEHGRLVGNTPPCLRVWEVVEDHAPAALGERLREPDEEAGPPVAARAVAEGEERIPFAVHGSADRALFGRDLDGVHDGSIDPGGPLAPWGGTLLDLERSGMPRVLIMASPEMVSELGSTILWRSDVDRVFAAPDLGLDGIHTHHPDLVILAGDDTAAALRSLGRIRADGRTRGVSVGVVRRSVTLDEETQLRKAGANVVFGGQVVPYLWDAWIEELLHVPRRREARVSVSIAVWSHTAPGSDPGRGTSVNISVKGMLLETVEPLDIGSKLDLTFTLPGTSGPVRAVGQVVREDALKDGGPPRLGIEFLILRDGARDRIRTYVEAGGGQ
jgi:hypothetical protein